MNKLTITGFVFLMLVALLCTGFVVMAELYQSPSTRPMPEAALFIEPKAMTENNGSYNVFLTIKAFAPDTINKLQLNRNVTGLTTYVNGTIVNTANPLQITLNGGDLIGVNFTIPCSEYSSINEVRVFSTSAMYGNVLPSSFQPHLVTDLGWYLHNSTDPVSNMTNKFTVYGVIENTGVLDAKNCRLIIEFYNDDKLLQTSSVAVGDICGFFHSAYLNSKNVPCDVADSVTRTEVHLEGDNIT